MLSLPLYLPTLLIVGTLAAVFFLYKSAGYNRTVLWVCGAWIALQAVVSLTGFYYTSFSFPPRFLLLIGPPIVFIVALLFHPEGKHFLGRLDLKMLTLLHIVRILVELCLHGLYQQGYVPVEMTFEGRNFDILSGISAALMAWWAFPVNTGSRRRLLLIWNIVCLALLFNIVGTAVAASPYFAANFGFEVTNRAVFYFPFVWLPCLIVPLVFLAHVASIWRLVK